MGIFDVDENIENVSFDRIYKLKRLYDDLSDGIQTFSINKNDEFASCRLIVKSSKNINVSGAVSVISGYKNLWVLQYDSEEKTKSAFEYYNSLPFVEYAEPDMAVEMYSLSSETPVLSKEELTKTSIPTVL